LHHDSQKPATDELAVDEICNIIRDTISDFKGNAGDADQPKWQYHRGATLLVVIGNIESVEIARKIVNALPGMSAIADSARARYGLGAPSPGDAASRAAAEEAFRARYGFIRSSPPVNQPQNSTPEPDTRK